MRFPLAAPSRFTGFRMKSMAFHLAVACISNEVAAVEPGDHRTHTEKWPHYGVMQTSEQTYLKAPMHDEGGYWENDGVTTWKDAKGNELARGLWVRGSLWNGRFLVPYGPEGDRTKLVALQDWDSGRLLKSVVPGWCTAPDDQFHVVPHVHERITDSFTGDRIPFGGWYAPATKAMQEEPLVEHAQKLNVAECYRMTVFPSFMAASVVRVDVRDDHAAEVVFKQSDGKLDSKPPTKIARSSQGKLKPEQLTELRRLVELTLLVSDIREVQARGLDGGHNVIEAIIDGKYYCRDYWSTDLLPVIALTNYFHRIPAPVDSDSKN